MLCLVLDALLILLHTVLLNCIDIVLVVAWICDNVIYKCHNNLLFRQQGQHIGIKRIYIQEINKRE